MLSTTLDPENREVVMKQRVCCIAALLFCVGAVCWAQVRAVRLRAKTAEGQTIFMSTHLLSIAEEIADRVGIIDQGELKFLGTLDELRQRLATHETSLERLYLSFTATDQDAAEQNGRAATQKPSTLSEEQRV